MPHPPILKTFAARSKKQRSYLYPSLSMAFRFNFDSSNNDTEVHCIDTPNILISVRSD